MAVDKTGVDEPGRYRVILPLNGFNYLQLPPIVDLTCTVYNTGTCNSKSLAMVMLIVRSWIGT